MFTQLSLCSCNILIHVWVCSDGAWTMCFCQHWWETQGKTSSDKVTSCSTWRRKESSSSMQWKPRRWWSWFSKVWSCSICCSDQWSPSRNLRVVVHWTSVRRAQEHSIRAFLTTQACVWSVPYPPVRFTLQVSAVQWWWTWSLPHLHLCSVSLDLSLLQVRPRLHTCRPNSSLSLAVKSYWAHNVIFKSWTTKCRTGQWGNAWRIWIEAAKCNSLMELRKVAEREDVFTDAVKDSLSPAKDLLCSIFSRL